MKDIVLYGLFISLALLIALADRSPIHGSATDVPNKIEGQFYFYLDGVVDQTLPGPYVYRVLFPCVTRSISIVTSISAITVDFFVKVILLACVLGFFFHYLMLFHLPPWSFAGALLCSCLILYTLSYINGPSVLETTDIANLLVFVLALSAMHRDRFILLTVVLLVGVLNRESPVVLVLLAAVNDWTRHKSAVRILVLVLAVVLPYVGLHLTIVPSGEAHWYTTEGLSRNIPFLSLEHTAKALVGNLRLLILLGPLTLAAAYRFKEHPQFQRLALILVPVIVLVHYGFGTIIESRLWLPVFPLLIPPAIGTLSRIMQTREENPINASS